MEQVLRDKISPLISAAEKLLQTIPLPDFLRSCDMAGQTILGNRKWPSPCPSVTVELKHVSDDVDFNAYLQSPEEEHHKIARQLWEEEQMNEELIGQIINLQIEDTSLQHENSNTESEITTETEPSNTV